MEVIRKSGAVLLVIALVSSAFVGIAGTASAQDVSDSDGDGVPNEVERLCGRDVVRTAFRQINDNPDLAGTFGACERGDAGSAAYPWCSPAAPDACWSYAPPMHTVEHEIAIPVLASPKPGADKDEDGFPSYVAFDEVTVHVRAGTGTGTPVVIDVVPSGTTTPIPLDPNDDPENGGAAEPNPVGCRGESAAFFLPNPAGVSPGDDADEDGVPATLVLGFVAKRITYDLCSGDPAVQIVDADVAVPQNPVTGAPLSQVVLDPNDDDRNIPIPDAAPGGNMDNDEYSNSDEIFAPSYLDGVFLLQEAFLDVGLLTTNQDAYFLQLQQAAMVSAGIFGQATYFTNDKNVADPDEDGVPTNQEEAAGTDPNDGRSHPNRPPSIIAPSTLEVQEGALLTAVLTARDRDVADDVDGVVLSLAASTASPVQAPGLPAGATLSPASAAAADASGEATFTLTWQPDFTQEGTYEVLLVAQDDGHQDARQSFSPRTSRVHEVTIVVTHANAPPVLAPASDPTVAEGATLSFTLSGSDIDEGATLTYAADALPSGATLDDATGEFAWTPDFAQAGLYSITFSVSDGSESDDATVEITVMNTNRAPTLVVPGDQLTAEGDLLEFTVDATDPDVGDVVVVTLANPPAGATFDGSTFTWTPTFSQSGPEVLEFTAMDTDGGATDSGIVNVSVTNTDRSVQLDPIGVQSVAEDATLSFAVTASDPDDEDTVSITHTALPEGAVFRGGTFEWQPGFDQAGTYDVTFTASSHPEVSQASETVTITVLNTNRAPVLEISPFEQVAENQLLVFVVTASDPDAGDEATPTAEDLPEGATFEDGVFSWTPSYTQAGTHSVRFVATDNHGPASTSETVEIHVTNVNRAPTLAPIGPLDLSEGTPFSLELVASDPDDQVLTISAEPLPAGAQMDGRWFTWTPTHDQSGPWEITFTVTDGDLSVDEVVTLSVDDVDRAPELSVDASFSVDENAFLTFTVTASDGDGDAVVISLKGEAPEGASFDPEDGTFEWTPGYTQAGSHVVVFEATSGPEGATKTTSRSVSITVVNVDRAPVFDAIDPPAVVESVAMTFAVVAQDPDGDTITYSATGLPDGAEFSASTGEFAWTPSFTQEGTYPVTFTATSGDLSASLLVELIVGHANAPPVLDALGSIQGSEDALLTFQIGATDVDDDVLTYSMTSSQLPEAAALDADGVFTWTPSFEDSGDYDVTFVVSDGEADDSVTVTIRILNLDRTPVLSVPEGIEGQEDVLLSAVISATDPDGEAVALDVSGLPEGATFDVETGAFEWIPSFAQAGLHTVVFSASAGGATVHESVSIDIANVDRAPTIAGVPVQTIAENALLSFALDATDPDGDEVVCTAPEKPSTATLEACTFSWTPDYDAEGPYAFTVTATAGGLSAVTEVQIDVTKTNRAPTLSITQQPTGGSEFVTGDEVCLTIAATDPDAEDVAALVLKGVFGGGVEVTATDGVACHAYAVDGPMALGATVTDGFVVVPAAGNTIQVWSATGDEDRDGLTNKQELTGSENVLYSNEPTKVTEADSDDDGLSDKAEIEAGSDPNLKRGTVCDNDGDGIPNAFESSATRRNRHAPVPNGLFIVGACENRPRSILQTDIDEDGTPFAYMDQDENGEYNDGDTRLTDTEDVTGAVEEGAGAAQQVAECATEPDTEPEEDVAGACATLAVVHAVLLMLQELPGQIAACADGSGAEEGAHDAAADACAAIAAAHEAAEEAEGTGRAAAACATGEADEADPPAETVCTLVGLAQDTAEGAGAAAGRVQECADGSGAAAEDSPVVAAACGAFAQAAESAGVAGDAVACATGDAEAPRAPADAVCTARTTVVDEADGVAACAGVPDAEGEDDGPVAGPVCGAIATVEGADDAAGEVQDCADGSGADPGAGEPAASVCPLIEAAVAAVMGADEAGFAALDEVDGDADWLPDDGEFIPCNGQDDAEEIDGRCDPESEPLDQSRDYTAPAGSVPPRPTSLAAILP